jgi:hypothetical protein
MFSIRIPQLQTVYQLSEANHINIKLQKLKEQKDEGIKNKKQKK